MPTVSRLNSALLDELRDSVAANRPVEAIKIVHERLGMGLIAAKAFVDDLIRDGLLAPKDVSTPLISFSVPRAHLWVCRVGGGLMILFAVVMAMLLLIQGAPLIVLGVIPIIAFGWIYGRFTNRPEVEFYSDRVNYKTLASRRSVRFEDVSSMALSPQGSGIRRALVLFVKDVANRLHPICVPNVFEQGRSIIQYLEAFTGLKCIAIQTPREHKQWRSEKVTMKDNASIEDSSKRNEAVNSVVERVDFSELSRRAFSEDGTREDKRKLWQATFALKEWYYLARGSLENPTPYCATAVQIEPDTYWLYAFTDPDRVEQFAHQLQGENAPFVYLTVPNPADRGAIARIMSYQEDGIKGIYFNCLDYGFYAPLSDLQALADAVMSRTSDSG